MATRCRCKNEPPRATEGHGKEDGWSAQGSKRDRHLIGLEILRIPTPLTFLVFFRASPRRSAVSFITRNRSSIDCLEKCGWGGGAPEEFGCAAKRGSASVGGAWRGLSPGQCLLPLAMVIGAVLIGVVLAAHTGYLITTWALSIYLQIRLRRELGTFGVKPMRMPAF